jgi:DNA-binding phage protein
MTLLHRDIELRRARGRALVQTLHRHELEEAGAARKAALAEADAQLERIAEHLSGAVRAGISMAEIARSTGVSRQTLYQLQKRHSAPDLRFAVLAAVAEMSTQTVAELARATAQEEATVREVVQRLAADGLLAVSAPPTGAERVSLTANGEDALAAWEFGTLEERTTRPLRLALDVLRFSPDERAEVDRKIAIAEANGISRLGLAKSLRMGLKASLDELLGPGAGTEQMPSGSPNQSDAPA